jgi:hypothetical protein
MVTRSVALLVTIERHHSLSSETSHCSAKQVLAEG